MQKLLQASISRSTQATYAGPLALYMAWCERWHRDPSARAISTGSAREWLAAVAGEKQLMGDTLPTYRSALSTAWAIAGGTGSNPVQDASISRLLQGYANQRQAADAAVRAQRLETISLTAELLAQISPSAPGYGGGQPRDIMCWAAACMLTFGLNRCAEIFSSSRIDRPALPMSAVQFFARPHDVVARALCPVGEDRMAHMPDHYEVSLGPTKADRMGRNPPQKIAAAIAVSALWRWAHVRRDLGGTEGPIFVVPGERPLTRKQLFAEIAAWHKAATGREAKVTGRAFRRGGQSSLFASGAAGSDMQHAGRWRSAAMPAVYSSAAAGATRGLHVSRGLGALFASAAASRQR